MKYAFYFLALIIGGFVIGTFFLDCNHCDTQVVHDVEIQKVDKDVAVSKTIYSYVVQREDGERSKVMDYEQLYLDLEKNDTVVIKENIGTGSICISKARPIYRDYDYYDVDSNIVLMYNAVVIGKQDYLIE